jgi:hypothetical protein
MGGTSDAHDSIEIMPEGAISRADGILECPFRRDKAYPTTADQILSWKWTIRTEGRRTLRRAADASAEDHIRATMRNKAGNAFRNSKNILVNDEL